MELYFSNDKITIIFPLIEIFRVLIALLFSLLLLKLLGLQNITIGSSIQEIRI